MFELLDDLADRECTRPKHAWKYMIRWRGYRCTACPAFVSETELTNYTYEKNY